MSERPDRSPDEEPPRPEPAEGAAEPVVAEPRRAEPEVEPIPVQPVAPIQIAPDPGAAPVTAEPVESAADPGASAAEPSESERPASEPEPTASDEKRAPAGEGAPETPSGEEALALPPATPEPPPQPERMPALEGVAVPFAAPPTERNSGRFAAALALGIGGGVAVLIAAVFALFASLFTLTESYMEKIEGTAEAFIADIEDEQWNDAYARLCPDMRDQPVEEYIDEWTAWEVEGADVQRVREEFDGTYVPVELADGSTVELSIRIEQGPDSIDTTVCGWDRKS